MIDPAAQSLALSLGVSALITVGCKRLRLPALLPLLGAGLLLGVSGAGVVNAESLGPVLKAIITVAIGLLIFEGALHLNRVELSRAPRAVWGLLTVGAVVTWVGAAVGAHVVLGLPWRISILLGATVIVTGPTVVQPLLRLLHVSPRLHTVLAAEAVLIDPIGVIATIATLEVLRLSEVLGPDASLAGEALRRFAVPLVGGAGVGLVMGMLGYALLRAADRAGRPDPQSLNLLAIGVCMTCVGVGEAVTAEAGLVAVTICGVMMARARVLGATELRAFKELLAVILVGTLFVLLASRFDVARLGSLSWRDGAFVLLLVFVVRPACVFLSTIGSVLTLRERIFAGTFAPRGIVALSVAAVAAAELRGGTPAPEGDAPPSDAERLELIMFTVIAGTVLLASTISPLLVRLLRVQAGEGRALILVGGHSLSIALAKRLAAHDVATRVIDTNDSRVASAALAGVNAIEGDATDARWMDDVGAPPDAGWLLAWTGNPDVDRFAVRWAAERFGPAHAVLWSATPVGGPPSGGDIGWGEPIGAMLRDPPDERGREPPRTRAPARPRWNAHGPGV
ncbi:MAG: sodium:proton antiporter [Planctomycetota bacterium]|nr:sodium:proton antiporter [Planctomycetota bacterium]